MIGRIIEALLKRLRIAPEDYERRVPYRREHTAVGCTMCGRCLVCGVDHEPKVKA